MNSAKIRIASALLGGMLMATGCTNITNPLETTYGSEEYASMKDDLQNDAHTTKKDDRRTGTVLYDEASGNSVTNVIKVQPTEGNTISREDIRDFMSRNDIPWIQMNLGTDLAGMSPATAYIFISPDMTYNEMYSYSEVFASGGYEAYPLGEEEYTAYQNKGDDIYYAETTYYPKAE